MEPQTKSSMESSSLLFTAVFLFYAAMEVMGMMPQEIQSAGGTLSYMFASFYGDQVSSLALTIYTGG